MNYTPNVRKSAQTFVNIAKGKGVVCLAFKNGATKPN